MGIFRKDKDDDIIVDAVKGVDNIINDWIGLKPVSAVYKLGEFVGLANVVETVTGVTRPDEILSKFQDDIHTKIKSVAKGKGINLPDIPRLPNFE